MSRDFREDAEDKSELNIYLFILIINLKKGNSGKDDVVVFKVRVKTGKYLKPLN